MKALIKFKDETKNLLELASVEYKKKSVLGQLNVSNQLAPNDINRAIETTKLMSEEQWEHLKLKIGQSNVVGWNLALYILNYEINPDEHSEDLYQYINSQN